ncbi:MAG: VacJ family lipoprotein [Fluviibacter sp.]
MPLLNKITFKRLMLGAALTLSVSGITVAEELPHPADTADVTTATQSAPAVAETYNNPRDPWEGFNRGVFAFNEGVDGVVIKPIAQGYEFIIPEPIRILVTNVFSNLGDVVIGINDLLQGRGEQAFNSFGRVVINTTLGFGGLFDVAGNAGWYKNDNDFGVTFARWGAPSGPFLMLPIVGPSNVRDTFGWAANVAASPLTFVVKDPTAYYTAWGVNFINTRANLFPAEKIIEEAATDRYSYLRDAFMQNRLNLIYDGEPPPGLAESPEDPGESDTLADQPATR